MNQNSQNPYAFAIANPGAVPALPEEPEQLWTRAFERYVPDVPRLLSHFVPPEPSFGALTQREVDALLRRGRR